MAAQAQFRAALDALVAVIKQDRSIAAAILCGSLSHDTVWAKSDIDLALVTVDGHVVGSPHRALYADGVNAHAFLMPRAEFRKAVEGSARNSFLHSLLAKGKLLYTHDPTIGDLCARLQEIGERDTQLQLLRAATAVLMPAYKARKWFVTRGDLDYASLWILFAANALARVEVIGARLLADREVLPQAMKLNPQLFECIYKSLLNTKKTRANVEAALDAMDGYLARRAPELFSPLIEYLNQSGEAMAATEIDDHFRRNFDVEAAALACEYLADLGLVGKVSQPVQLTRKSNVMVQELAFVHLGDVPDEF